MATNEIIEGYQDDEYPEIREDWRIENLGSVDWALSRLAEIEAAENAISAQVVAAIQRVEDRAHALRNRLAKGRAFFEAQIQAYAHGNRKELLGTGKKKSRDFLHGKIGFRGAGGLLRKTDPAALEAWLTEQPIESGLYRQKIEPEMKVLQALYKATGQVPPGMVFEPEREVVTIEPALALTKHKE